MQLGSGLCTLCAVYLVVDVVGSGVVVVVVDVVGSGVVDVVVVDVVVGM